MDLGVSNWELQTLAMVNIINYIITAILNSKKREQNIKKLMYF
jgi:hypothetical protein